MYKDTTRILRRGEAKVEGGILEFEFPLLPARSYTLLVEVVGSEDEEFEIDVLTKEQFEEYEEEKKLRKNRRDGIVKRTKKLVVKEVDKKVSPLSEALTNFSVKIEEFGNTLSSYKREDSDYNTLMDRIQELENIKTTPQIPHVMHVDSGNYERFTEEVNSKITKLISTIPTGGILDYIVDDSKEGEKILRSSQKVKDFVIANRVEIKKVKTGTQSFFPGNNIDDVTASAFTTYSSEYIEANFGTGDVSKSGTPVAGQLAIRSADGIIYGDPEVTVAPQQFILGSPGNIHIIQGPHAVTTGTGGGFWLKGGDGGSSSGSGATVRILGGNSTGSSGSGGAAQVIGGNSTNGTSGSATLSAGTSTNGNGAAASVLGGWGNLTTGTGGAVNLVAGNGFVKGAFNARQYAGQYKFSADGTTTATKQGTLDFSAVTTSAKTFTFPNATGNVVIDAHTNNFTATQTFSQIDIGIVSSPSGVLNVVGRIDQRFPGNTLNNIMIGQSAGNTSGTGNYNIGIGRLALQVFTTGFSNVGIGDQALTALTEGFDNYAIGTSALGALTDGDQNTAIGTGAGQFGNPTGITAIGYQALRNANYNQAVGIGYATATAGGGFYGTIIGGGAGQSITGQKNVAIGAFAGYEITTGTQNVILGNEAGGGLGNVSNKLIIHNTTSATPLIYGDFSARTLRANGQLSALSSTGTQLTLHYDGSQSATFGVGGGGALTIRPSGLYTDLDSLTINLGDINGSGNFTRFSLTDGTPEIKAEFGGSLTYYNSQVSDYFMLKFVAGGEDFGTRKYYWNANTLIEEKMSDWSAEVEASALLELRSNNETGYGHKGFLPPRMTEEQRDSIASPAIGLLIVNTDTNPETLDMYTSSGRLKLTPA